MQLAAILAVALATPASAIVISGTTTGAPTFTRANQGAPPTSLTSFGDVAYEATSFFVSQAGSYDFQTGPGTSGGYDTFLHLYQGSFDPSAALSNVLIGNDDRNFGYAGFTTNLLTGTNYIAVVSGFGTTSSGSYSLTITGPGDITLGSLNTGAVPEPESWAMLIAGFGLVGTALRRRRSACRTA